MYPLLKSLPKNFAETMSKEVEQFNKAEIDCLIKEFNKLSRDPAKPDTLVRGLNRAQFRSILLSAFGMTDDRLMDRVFEVFDKDIDGFVSTKEWIEGMAVILRGTLEEKIKYCFCVYDLKEDNYITRDEVTRLLDNSLIRDPAEEDPDEGIKDLVEMTFRKMDHDRDGRLSLDDFEKSVKEESLLLEAFGTCLPDLMSIAKFEEHLFEELQEP